MSPPSPRDFEGNSWIGLYRATHNIPDLFGNPTWPHNKQTVAVAEIDGRIEIGVSSLAPGYTDKDFYVASRTRDVLMSKYPHLTKENIGEAPWDSAFHAESTILLRATNRSGGTLAGKVIEIQTDREMCLTSCPVLLPKLGLEVGNPTVTFVGPNGSRRTMRNGELGLGEMAMRKKAYFDSHWGSGWPSPDHVQSCLAEADGRQRFFAKGYDGGSFFAEGLYGTEALQPKSGRIDISLYMYANLVHGILLIYKKWDGRIQEGRGYHSKGDLARLREHVMSFHDVALPIGLFVSFEAGCRAMREFIESDGKLPTAIWDGGTPG